VAALDQRLDDRRAGRDKQLQSHLEPLAVVLQLADQPDRGGGIGTSSATIRRSRASPRRLRTSSEGSETVGGGAEAGIQSLWNGHITILKDHRLANPSRPAAASLELRGGVVFKRILLVTGVRRVRVPLLAFLRASDFSGPRRERKSGRRGGHWVEDRFKPDAHSWIGLCATGGGQPDRASEVYTNPLNLEPQVRELLSTSTIWTMRERLRASGAFRPRTQATRRPHAAAGS